MIKSKIKKGINYILGSENNFSLEHRLLLSAIIIGAFIGFFGCIANIFLTNSLISSVIPFSLAILAVILYYFARFKNKYEKIALITAITGIIGISIVWIFNGGINGPNIMFSLVFLMLGLIVVSNKTKNFIIVFFILTNIFILLIQFYKPEIIVPYPTEFDRWIDILTSLIFSSIFIFFIIRFFHNNYTIERQRAEESEYLYIETQKIGKMGGWSYDVESEQMTFTDTIFEIYGKRFSSAEEGIKFYHPDDKEKVWNAFSDAISKQKPYDLDVRFINAQGDNLFVRTIGKPIIKNGKVVKVYGNLVNITEQKIAELELIKTEKRAAELAIVNKELEQFSYLASHDLQEPLRTVTNYMKVFEEDYYGLLDDTARKYLLSVKTATERMRILIKSLLDFSQLGRNRSCVYVDCKKIINKVISNLDNIINASDAIIDIDEMPKLNLYEIEMHELFQNLITNAIKFQKKGNQPKIKIRAEEINNTWKFSISDNGIGIAPIYFERIFDVFQRLHTNEEYEGTGIGLANCKKIVEFHQGEIWVESTLGQGTSFYFTIQNLTL
jgi:signal transduction histidine kinase